MTPGLENEFQDESANERPPDPIDPETVRQLFAALAEMGRQNRLVKRLSEIAASTAIFVTIVVGGSELYEQYVVSPAHISAESGAKISDLANDVFAEQVRMGHELGESLSHPSFTESDDSIQTPLYVNRRTVNDVSAADALLKEIKSVDLDMNALEILIESAFDAGQIREASHFIDRYSRKPGASHAQSLRAKQYDAKYRFEIHQPAAGRELFASLIGGLSTSPEDTTERAWALADWAALELKSGECSVFVVVAKLSVITSFREVENRSALYFGKFEPIQKLNMIKTLNGLENGELLGPTADGKGAVAWTLIAPLITKNNDGRCPVSEMWVTELAGDLGLKSAATKR